MEILKFPIYGDKIIAKLDSEDEIDDIDYIEIIGETETIWLAEEKDYNVIEALEVEAKVKGKKMMIYIIKLQNGSIVIEGKSKRRRKK